ncbi:acyl-CoA N-acyltransferase [Chytridium lagenaria]|nr:acyl-CoA N-acyltransferase [Chytridium lagenaria]
MSSPEIFIQEEPLESEVCQTLIKALNASLMESNPNPAAHSMSLSPSETAPGLGIFLVVYAQHPNEPKTPIGCGALRKIILPPSDLTLLDTTLSNPSSTTHSIAELKRMYVDPTYRGLGIGRMMVKRLEEEARRLNVGRLLLETGPELVAAVKVYEGCGFVRVHNYGEYAVKDPEDSICYGKDLL